MCFNIMLTFLFKSRILSQIEKNPLRYRIPDTPGYKDIRKTFFQSYGLDLKDSHNTYFLLSKLLNPKNIIEC